MRIYFSIKWPVRAINKGRGGIKFEIDYQTLLKNYPFLQGANFCKPTTSVNQNPPKKKKLSVIEQEKLYRKLLDTGEVKNKAAIARKFRVSRAWVTKVLSR